jgi:uncharacterized protein YacL
MNFYVSGILGTAMLAASISTMTVTKEQHDVLRKVLSDDLDKVYENIIAERRNHYIIGLVLGLALSYTVLKFLKISNRFHRMSLFVLITLVTGGLFYSLMPKSDYMLNHLKTEEENKRWLEVYKTMKQRYLIGFIFGALAAVPLANALC